MARGLRAGHVHGGGTMAAAVSRTTPPAVGGRIATMHAVHERLYRASPAFRQTVREVSWLPAGLRPMWGTDLRDAVGAPLATLVRVPGLALD